MVDPHSRPERPRSSSSGAALNGPMRGLSRHSTIGPIPQHRQRGNRRSAPPSQGGIAWRRASAPLSGLLGGSQRRRRATSGHLTSSSSQEINGYGTIQENEVDPIEPDETAPLRPRQSSTTGGLLAGPRRSLLGAWQQGRDYLSRWRGTSTSTSPRAGNRADQIENDGSSSPLLPRIEAHPPWAHAHERPDSPPSSL
jgi:hypothetical protein